MMSSMISEQLGRDVVCDQAFDITAIGKDRQI